MLYLLMRIRGLLTAAEALLIAMAYTTEVYDGPTKFQRDPGERRRIIEYTRNDAALKLAWCRPRRHRRWRHGSAGSRARRGGRASGPPALRRVDRRCSTCSTCSPSTRTRLQVERVAALEVSSRGGRLGRRMRTNRSARPARSGWSAVPAAHPPRVLARDQPRAHVRVRHARTLHAPAAREVVELEDPARQRARTLGGGARPGRARRPP